MDVSVSSIGSTFSTGFEVSNFQAIDLNIDGYIDFVVAGFEESDSLVWYENDGSSSFTKLSLPGFLIFGSAGGGSSSPVK